MSLQLILAPIRGLTDAAFRRAYAEQFGGFDEALAPFLAPELPRPLRPKDLAEVSPKSNDLLPTVPQVLAADPDVFLQTAKKLSELGCTRVNWNLGCPQPPVTRAGRGAGLLPFPEKIAAFLDKVMPAIGMAVSVKLRLGLHDASELGPVLVVLNRYPLQEVIIHARTADQMYKGRVDPDAFERYAPGCRHPLVYNGDIVDVAGFHALSARFPFVSRWMIGRGAIAEPTLPGMLRGAVMDPEERRVRMRRLHDAMFDHYARTLSGPSHVLDKMTGLWEYWTDAIEGKRKAIKRIRKCTELERYRKGVQEIFD